MRAAFPLLALTLATGAAAEPAAPTPAPRTVIRVPASASPLTPPEGRVPCRDTIQEVRDERGLPQLQRETASTDDPMLIAAVDHRINGCSVMVMYDNTSDVRPLPALPESPPRLERLPSR